MESWSIKELNQFLKTFDEASQEDIVKARELLKEKLALKGVVTT
jgi:hypothetical protein